jgi:hypothetical protein
MEDPLIDELSLPVPEHVVTPKKKKSSSSTKRKHEAAEQPTPRPKSKSSKKIRHEPEPERIVLEKETINHEMVVPKITKHIDAKREHIDEMHENGASSDSIGDQLNNYLKHVVESKLPPEVRVYISLNHDNGSNSASLFNRVVMAVAHDEKEAKRVIDAELEYIGLMGSKHHDYILKEIPRDVGEFAEIIDIDASVHKPKLSINSANHDSSLIHEPLHVFCSEHHAGPDEEYMPNKFAYVVARDSSRAKKLLDDKLKERALPTSQMFRYSFKNITSSGQINAMIFHCSRI